MQLLVRHSGSTSFQASKMTRTSQGVLDDNTMNTMDIFSRFFQLSDLSRFGRGARERKLKYVMVTSRPTAFCNSEIREQSVDETGGEYRNSSPLRLNAGRLGRSSGETTAFKHSHLRTNLAHIISCLGDFAMLTLLHDESQV
jgi:hypothetical protein